MRILSPRAMAQVDARAIEEIGVPGAVLMENAALAVVQATLQLIPEGRRVTILCGPGNNGGDGLAVGRHLYSRGLAVDLFLFAKEGPAGDAGLQLSICQRLGLEPRWVRPGEQDEAWKAELDRSLRESDAAIDALFGTGLSRPLQGCFAEAVEILARLRDAAGLTVVAVDLPSGLYGGLEQERRGELLSPAAADLTVTFAAPKPVHVFADEEHLGAVVVADLGLPAELVESSPGAQEGVLHLLTTEELGAYLPARSAQGHKGTFGHVLLLAGSAGKSGAAVLAARGAVRGGAGLVTVAVPAGLLSLVDAGSLESMTLALPQSAEGTVLEAAVATLKEHWEGKGALAVGPGLGRGEAVTRVVEAALAAARRRGIPAVIDADGLFPYAERCADLRGTQNGEASGTGELSATDDPSGTGLGPLDLVLTPHPGEMARLLGLASAPVSPGERLAAVRRAARESGAVVVLKGHRTLIAEPLGEVWVNPTGNVGMASGGTGDVLTGIIAALLAQGFDPLAAAQLGVFLHGLAGDLAAADGDLRALRAGDLVERLGEAFRELLRGEEG
ncbi:MAG: NAD(P)H-hydrate dehydratase [Acidobacteriota bacterium]